jgi:hypothetical protein
MQVDSEPPIQISQGLAHHGLSPFQPAAEKLPSSAAAMNVRSGSSETPSSMCAACDPTSSTIALREAGRPTADAQRQSDNLSTFLR